MKVLLAGEGATDLGDWAKERAWRPTPCACGVVEALARAAADGDWTIEDAVLWKSVRKYKAGDHRHPETRNVLGLVLAARERRCEAVLFVRDRDGDREREEDVESGLREVAGNADLATVAVGGGVAVEAIEAWLLAVLGENDTEGLTTPKSVLDDRGFVTCADKVRLVRDQGLDRIPAGARSLLMWMVRVRHALNRTSERC